MTALQLRSFLQGHTTTGEIVAALQLLLVGKPLDT